MSTDGAKDSAVKNPGKSPWVMLDVDNFKSKREVRIAAQPPFGADGVSSYSVLRVKRPPNAADGRNPSDIKLLTGKLRQRVNALIHDFSRFLRDPTVVQTLGIRYDYRDRGEEEVDFHDNQAARLLNELLRWNFAAEKTPKPKSVQEEAPASQPRSKPMAAATTTGLPSRWLWMAGASGASKNVLVDEETCAQVAASPAVAEPFVALGAWDPACWIDSDGLGPVARLLLLLEFLLAEYQDDLGEEIQHGGASLQDVVGKFLTDLNRNTAAAATTPTFYQVPWPEYRALAEALNRLPCRRHLLPVIYTDLVQQPFGPVLGIDSLNDYRHWLRHGVTPFTRREANVGPVETMPAKDASSKVATSWLSDKGAALLDDLRQHLHGTAHGRPVVLLHSVTRPSWLRTIAKEVVSPGPQGSPLKRHVVWLQAANPGDRNHLSTVRAFLKPLCLAFGVTLWPETATPDASQVVMVLEALRGALWGTPCVVVVDGVFNAGDTRVAPLLDFMSDTSELIDLIRALATPPVEEAFAPDTRSELDDAHAILYCQSRFLVLSSQPCGALEPVTSKSFELPLALPGASDVQSAVTRVSNSLEAHFGWRLDETGLHTGTLASNPSPWADATDARFAAERNAIWALLAMLRARQSPYLLVAGFIAGSADGMLQASLQRTFGIWRGLVGADKEGFPKEVRDFCFRAGGIIQGLAAAESSARTFARVIPSTWAPDDFADFADDADTTLRRFMTCLGPLLSVDIEQVVEDGLGERQLKWEVGPMPGGKADRSDASDAPSQRKGSFRRGIAIWNPLVRDVIAEFFLSHDTGSVREVGGLLGRRGWQLIHAASASEVLRQGTALLRSSHAQDLSSLSRYRRMVQCQYHLVIAGELKDIKLPGVDHDTFDHQSLFLPKESYIRASWAFVILYRSILERHSSWRLTRHWARSELRTAILTQFMYPGHQPRFVPMPVPDTVLEESLTTQGSPRNDAMDAWGRLSANWESALHVESASLRSLGMWNIYLTNITNAAVDSEDRNMLSFTEAALERIKNILPEAQARADAATGKATENGQAAAQRETLNFNFEKTIADVKDKTGVPAATLWQVERGLADRGVRFPLEEHLQTAATRIANLVIGSESDHASLSLATKQQPTLITKAASILRDVIEKMPIKPDLPADFLDGIDSLLCRHGSFLADKASRVPVERFEGRFRALMLAFVTFYVADAVRDMVGQAAEAHGRSFGYVSSRYWRVAIRTTLSLARLLSRSKSEGKLVARRWFELDEVHETVDWLLDNARARCDILVRDTHVFDRERMFAILAQVAVVRTMAGIGKDRGLSHDVIKSRLADAVGYLGAAERRYIQLGSPLALARRYYVERIATLCAWIRFASTDASVDRALTLRIACMALNDLDTLDGHAAGSNFWGWLWVQRFRKFRSMCEELKLPIDIPKSLIDRHAELAKSLQSRFPETP